MAEADALLQTGQPKDANAAAEAALELGGRTGDVFVQVSAILALAQVARFSGDIKAAEDWASAAEHLVRSSDLKVAQKRQLEGRAVGLRAVCAAVRGRMAEAREGFESAGMSAAARRAIARARDNPAQTWATLQHEGDTRPRKSRSLQPHRWRVVGDRTRFATSSRCSASCTCIGNVEAAGARCTRALEAANEPLRRIEAW